MPRFQKYSPHQNGRAVLLSIKPKYADLIISGSKRVEFRRSWAANKVGVIVLYSSSPIKKIIGIAKIDKVVTGSATALWEISKERGGGLTRSELRSYFSGKRMGVALFIGDIFRPEELVDPKNLLDKFIPPQSFRYLNNSEYSKIENELFKASE